MNQHSYEGRFRPNYPRRLAPELQTYMGLVPPFLPPFCRSPADMMLMRENAEHQEELQKYMFPSDFDFSYKEPQYAPYSYNDGSEIPFMHTLDNFGAESAAPKGSRLAKYMGASSTRPGSSTSTLNANVPSFVPQFAKMAMNDGNAAAPNGPAPFVPRQQYGNGLNGLAQDMNKPMYQHEMQGGTMYFFQNENSTAAPASGQGLEHLNELGDPNHTYINTNGSFTYHGPVPHIGKFRPKPNVNGVSQFMAPELKMEMLNRQLAMESRADPGHYPDLPQQVEHLNNLVPLENTLSHNTQTVYRAHSVRDGVPYCVRRLHNYRLQHTENLKNLEKWKKLAHINIVQLKEVIAHTRAFGDNSLLFVYDYYPLADTLKTRHFGRMQGSGFVDGITGAKISNPHPAPQLGAGVSESILWSYIIQISAALRVIHASGLSYRSLDLSKILIFGKNKILLGCAGMADLLNLQSDANLIKNQLQDCVAFGEMLLQLATGNTFAAKREIINQSYQYVTNHYSMDMNNLVRFLMNSHSPSTTQFPRRGINEVMPMIGARFYMQLETMQAKTDVLENELSKELENGRLFRLLSKINTIVERAENHIDPSWSETGDRFLLKLFRDYIFHQVMENGKPWLDMAHIVQCLNKLDSGVPEKIELVSRDGENLIIVSYGDLKRCVETAFRDLVSTLSVVPRH